MPVSMNNTTLTFNDATTQTTAPTISSATAVASTGISVTAITTTGAATHTITNTGVTSIVAGTSISISGATGAVTVTNGGVTSAVAGNGVAVSGATGAVTFSLGVPTGSSVGTYTAGMINNTTTTFSIGSTVAGSTINFVGLDPTITNVFFSNFTPTTSLGLSGTWRACTVSRSRVGSCCQPDQYSGNLWIRIA